MRKTNTLNMTVLLLFTATLVQAEKTPEGGIYDFRVRQVNFEPTQVYRITGHYGYQTDIQFADDELVTDIAVGDKEAWTIGPVRNHVFIKPKADEAHTNLSVLTNKHAYYFVLDAHDTKQGPKARDMAFAIKFNYPQEQQRETIAQQQKVSVAQKLNDRPKMRFKSYGVKGARSLEPTEVWNDLRFTYMRFSSDQEMPAIYVTNANGSESLVNTHVEGDVIVAHRVPRKLVLRKGSAVTCLFNLAVPLRGLININRTASPFIKRTIKKSPTGSEQPVSRLQPSAPVTKPAVINTSALDANGVAAVPDALKHLENIRDEFAKRKENLEAQKAQQR